MIRIALPKKKIIQIIRKYVPNKTTAKMLSKALIEESQTQNVPLTGKPKLNSVNNPNSGHYDDTPKLTYTISRALFLHQIKKGRIGVKIINNANRQWIFLVQIKRAIISLVGEDTTKVRNMASKLFAESEKMSAKFGKRNIYLNMVVSRIDELLDLVSDSDSVKIKIRDRRVWRAYRYRREKITGVKLNKEIEPGSDDHNIIKEISRITRKYKILPKLFMAIQFAAFESVNSFPRLKDLITRNAIDRLEQGMLKYRSDNMGEEDREYWNEVDSRTNK